MTKNDLMTVLALLNGETVDTDGLRERVTKELNRNAERAQANRNLYEQAHDAVMAAFEHINTPVTLAELWEDVKGEMPDGFAKGKLQYAMTRLWASEFVKTEGKVNTYSRA